MHSPLASAMSPVRDGGPRALRGVAPAAPHVGIHRLGSPVRPSPDVLTPDHPSEPAAPLWVSATGTAPALSGSTSAGHLASRAASVLGASTPSTIAGRGVTPISAGPTVGLPHLAPWPRPGPPLPPVPLEGPCVSPLIALPVRMSKPPFASLDPATKECFQRLFGPDIADWPPDGCCPPDPATRPCAWTPGPEMRMEFLTPLRANELWRDPDREAIWRHAAPPLEINDVAAIPSMRAMYQDAIQFLRDNIDLVDWGICLNEQWNDRMLAIPYPERAALGACLRSAIIGGRHNFPSIIGSFSESVEDAGGTHLYWGPAGVGGSTYSYGHPRADGTVGVIIPMDQVWWRERLTLYRSGTVEDGLCAVIASAATILHEMTHMCGDALAQHIDDPRKERSADDMFLRDVACDERNSPGFALGEYLSCGEATRMISSVFWWAAVRRYGCATLSPCCVPFADDSRFLISDCNSKTWSAGCP
ncbi:MAG: hypothetical protein ACI9K2_007361 [Myxococcota bacterium]